MMLLKSRAPPLRSQKLLLQPSQATLQHRVALCTAPRHTTTVPEPSQARIRILSGIRNHHSLVRPAPSASASSLLITGPTGNAGPGSKRPVFAASAVGKQHQSVVSPSLSHRLPQGRRMMSTLDLGAAASLDHSRYAVTLSSGKRLVVFRLPRISNSTDPALPNASDATAAASASASAAHGNAWSYYAMEAECPHAGGPMTDAHIDIEDSAYIASCPWHAYDFNVETGESSYGIKACTFPVEVADGRVVLRLPNSSGLTLSAIEPVSEKVKFKHGSRIDAAAPPKYLDDDATVCDWCVHILNTTDPELKIELTTHLFSIFATREQSSNPMKLGAGTITPPDEPPRDANITKIEPSNTPRRGRGGTLKSRIAMLHALANIEQWAIDLAIDICVRFATFQTVAVENGLGPQPLPRTFYYDWLKVANDEAKHFSLLRARLEEMGSHFGALAVHHGLWESAVRTSHDLRARISVIALVHEARGLDVNPMTIEKFRNAKDMESVDVLEIIHNDEITHVTTGHRWLTWICEQEQTDPVKVFRANVQEHFRGALRGPFNNEARAQAGMGRQYYEDLAGQPGAAEIIAGG